MPDKICGYQAFFISRKLPYISRKLPFLRRNIGKNIGKSVFFSRIHYTTLSENLIKDGITGQSGQGSLGQIPLELQALIGPFQIFRFLFQPLQ